MNRSFKKNFLFNLNKNLLKRNISLFPLADQLSRYNEVTTDIAVKRQKVNAECKRDTVLSGSEHE